MVYCHATRTLISEHPTHQHHVYYDAYAHPPCKKHHASNPIHRSMQIKYYEPGVELLFLTHRVSVVHQCSENLLQVCHPLRVQGVVRYKTMFVLLC
jgi:hypothetical protein